ncbi:hypothetical protein [Rudaeicoccus suwonensis]|uniref:HTH cro/C1-type domain-containing protein n=1 Tax=Rudaeicoccus suwonensis TaxID=657409 RepID=A0A561E719_9MICO|nr:hypothetical protein [Rudaeicoccus suwonensis]TWE11416.1 hypothetical protein BKA23_0182 [Rudaeicoccus suwonensis]
MSDVEPLRVPDFTERLLLAADEARMNAAQVRDGLRAIGVETGEKSIYKLFNGTIKNPTTATLAGLGKVLGTDVRWFCEPDDDGSLYRALSSHWALQRRVDDMTEGPERD